MVAEPDPRLLKAIRELHEERERRFKAERKATAMQARFAQLKAQRANDAKAQPHPAR